MGREDTGNRASDSREAGHDAAEQKGSADTSRRKEFGMAGSSVTPSRTEADEKNLGSCQGGINKTSPLAEANDYRTKLQRAKRLRYDALSRYVLGKLPKADLTEW